MVGCGLPDWRLMGVDLAFGMGHKGEDRALMGYLSKSSCEAWDGCKGKKEGWNRDPAGKGSCE